MQVQEQQGERSLLKMYGASFKSPESARCYSYNLRKYANDDLESLLKLSQREAEDKLIDFIITNKENGVSWGKLHNIVAAVAKFYLINDVSLNLNRVKRFMPEQVKLRKDRGIKSDEVSKVLELASERVRALVLLLYSSGCRIGGVVGLKMGDLEDRDDIYKITVYANTKSEYITYVTPEGKRALATYFNIRKMHSEDTTNKNHPVIREQYNKDNPLSVKYPKFTTKASLNRVLDEILQRAGIRTRMQQVENTRPSLALYKKDVSLTTGFRKAYNTQLANSGVNLVVKELLMGHLHAGLEENYYRPQEQYIENEYRKAISALTIDPSLSMARRITSLEAENTEIQALAL
jgi:integrase